MSQYCRPDGILMPSPVTFVGAFVLGGRDACEGLLVAVCAHTMLAIEENRCKTHSYLHHRSIFPYRN